MYEKIDRFLNVETWSSRHPNDEKRFFQALDTIVKHPDFNADQMAEYMRQKIGIDINDEQHPLAAAIDHYQTEAWAVWYYLKATQE